MMCDIWLDQNFLNQIIKIHYLLLYHLYVNHYVQIALFMYQTWTKHCGHLFLRFMDKLCSSQQYGSVTEITTLAVY